MLSGHNGQASVDVNRVEIKLRLGVLFIILSKRIHFKNILIWLKKPLKQLLTTDLLVLASMKNVAKCDN